MEIEAIADEIAIPCFEDSLPYKRPPSPRVQHVVDTITHAPQEPQIAPLAWHESPWCPWNWGDKIRQFENWVERKINSDFDKECKEVEKAQKEYEKAQKEWNNLPHEEKLMLQEANRIAMEQRYPNLIYSQSTMDQKKDLLDQLHEEFVDKNWAEIHKLPNDIQKIIINGVVVISGVTVAIISDPISLTALGSAEALCHIRHLVIDADNIKLALEGLERNNEAYFKTALEYYNMNEENKKASHEKCEKEGYKPELRFVENVPKHLLDFSQCYVDINAGSNGGPVFNIGFDWSF